MAANEKDLNLIATISDCVQYAPDESLSPNDFTGLAELVKKYLHRNAILMHFFLGRSENRVRQLGIGDDFIKIELNALKIKYPTRKKK